MSITAVLGDKLVQKDGAGQKEVDTTAALEDCDYVGVYFSAHWCPPCRGFTPVLGKFVTANGERLKFRVVFASNDKSAAEFSSYFASHAWDLAIPFGSPAISRLGSTWRVRGIPTLVIIDAKTGEVVAADGREGVVEDAEGARFPWRPRGVWEILADVPGAAPFTDLEGKAYSLDDLKAAASKGLGLYFSAHWCPPCRGFTPKLAAWYEARKAAGDGLEILFVSSDRDEASWRGYVGEMPWKAMDLSAGKAAKAALSAKYEVQGIPTLVFVSPDGTTITTSGREKVTSDPTGFPWPPKACDSLADAASEYINDQPVAILLTDNLTDAAAEVSVTTAFQAIAQESFAAGDGKAWAPDAVRFAVGAEGDEALEVVRRALKLTKDRTGPTSFRLLVLNVPEGHKAVYSGAALPGEEEIRAFIAGYKAGTAATVPMDA